MVEVRNKSIFEEKIAKLYLYCLTFRMISPLVEVLAPLKAVASRFDFILNVLGIVLYLLTTRGVIPYNRNSSNGKLFSFFAGMLLLFNCTSLIMATVFQIVYGNHGTESAFSGILGSEIYCIHYIIIVAYNRRIFSIISKELIDKIVGRVCIFLLCLGYFQIFWLSFGGVFEKILNTVDVFYILHPAYAMEKLPLTETEGASAGGLFGIFVLPYLLSKIVVDQDRRKNWIQIMLWVPVVIFMRSTSAVFITIGAILAYLLVIKRTRTHFLLIFLLAIVLTVLYFIGFEKIISFISKITPADINLKYLIFEKLIDQDNASTVERIIPLYINFGAFKEWPLFGCGNGLQGYFYEKYFPQFALNVTYNITILKDLYTAKNQIYNGSLLLPSILSGYGIVGTSVFVVYVIKSLRHVRARIDAMGHFGYYYLIACGALLVHGFQGGISGRYYIWFVLSLPYLLSQESVQDQDAYRKERNSV